MYNTLHDNEHHGLTMARTRAAEQRAKANRTKLAAAAAKMARKAGIAVTARQLSDHSDTDLHAIITHAGAVLKAEAMTRDMTINLGREVSRA